MRVPQSVRTQRDVRGLEAVLDGGLVHRDEHDYRGRVYGLLGRASVELLTY